MEFKVGQKYIVTDGTQKDTVIKLTEKIVGMFGSIRFKYKVVKKVGEPTSYFNFDVNSAFASWLQPVKNETIVIYRDGNKTVALDKTTGTKAVAKCSPNDTYDFTTGAKLAFERLTKPVESTPYKEVKRKAKAGEYVKIVDAKHVSQTNGKPDYKNGDILQITEVKNNVVVRYGKNTGKYLYDSEYVVLEGYQPPEEKPAFVPYLKLNGKFVGEIGNDTPIKDNLGRKLKVGDTVLLYGDHVDGEEAVIAKEEKAYVMGIESRCKPDGTIQGNWVIVKKRSYKEIPNGEKVDGIKYVKEP